jgi:hypothetical protein
MTAHVLVWDLEAVPDLRGFAAANGLDGKSDDEIRAVNRGTLIRRYCFCSMRPSRILNS